MKRIVNMNPDSAGQYLTPNTTKALLITMGIKLVLSVAFLFMTKAEDLSNISAVLFYMVMFALIYDVCSFYQVCLQISQSIFIGFLLFLLLLLGAVFIFTYAFSFLAGFAPATATGQNISMIIMIIVCLIPFFIDVIRLVRMTLIKK